MLPMPGPGLLSAAGGAAAVGALAPQALEQFAQAMTELAATVGEALLPAFEALTEVVRMVADAIAPLMQALAPILKELADIFSTLLLGAVYALVGIFTALGSVLGGTADGLKSFKQGLMDFVRLMLRGLAYLIKAFAGAEAVGKWAEAVKGVGTRAELAPRGATVTGLEEIGKSITSAAFGAGGGADIQEDMRNFQAKIAEDLEEVRDNGKDFWDWLENEFIKKLADAIAAAIKGTASSFIGGGHRERAEQLAREIIKERGDFVPGEEGSRGGGGGF